MELKDFENLDLSGMKIGIDWEYFKVMFVWIYFLKVFIHCSGEFCNMLCVALCT